MEKNHVILRSKMGFLMEVNYPKRQHKGGTLKNRGIKVTEWIG